MARSLCRPVPWGYGVAPFAVTYISAPTTGSTVLEQQRGFAPLAARGSRNVSR